MGRSGLLLLCKVVGSLLVDDVPARSLFLADVIRGPRLVSIYYFVQEMDVASSIVLDSFDEASVSHGATQID